MNVHKTSGTGQNHMSATRFNVQGWKSHMGTCTHLHTWRILEVIQHVLLFYLPPTITKLHFLSTDWKPISRTLAAATLFLSGSVVFTTTSTSGWESLSLTAPVWMRGGEMDGMMAPVIEWLCWERFEDLSKPCRWYKTPLNWAHVWVLRFSGFVLI